MQSTIHRQAILPYSNQQMFLLVNDVKAYPQFIPYCSKVNVISESEQALEASLELKKGIFKQSFTTANVLDFPNQITMNLQEGPFTSFSGVWQFHSLSDTACRVELRLDFELSAGVGSKMFQSLFEKVAGQMVDAFCQRAKEVYG